MQKSMPYCKFSDFQPKSRTSIVHNRDSVRKEFSDMPNYYL